MSGGYTPLIIGGVILGVFGGFGAIVVLTSEAVYDKNKDIDNLSGPRTPPAPPAPPPPDGRRDRRYRRLAELVGKDDEPPPLH